MRQLPILILAAAILVGCDDDGPVASKDGPGLRIVAGAGISDTIGAMPTQGLVVELRGTDGELLQGAEVRFESSAESRTYVSPVSSASWEYVAGAMTDIRGQATMRVRLGEQAGEGWVAISVPQFNLTDTARYTVLPGKAHFVLLSPSDTAIELGASFTYRGTVQDRNGNPRQDPATFEVVGNAVTVTPSGTVTAREYGIATVRARASINGAIAVAEGRVAVVPEGVIAWGNYGSITVTNLSGTQLRTIHSTGLAPSWEPGGNRFVVTNDGLYLVNADNTVTALPTPGFTGSTWPEWSADGYIYFSGHTSEGLRIGRVRPDGSGIEQLIDETGEMPSPSPDGTRIAYSNGALYILDLQTRETRMLEGTFNVVGPRWSPDGNWIAYLEGWLGGLYLIRPDGTGLHRVGDQGLYPGITWSPDSRWILGSYGFAALVDVNAGIMTRLSFGFGDSYAAWKR